MFIEGQFLVPRTISEVRGGRRRTRQGWVRHWDDCTAGVRSAADKRQPAPVKPYADTIDCSQCSPQNPHRLIITGEGADLKGHCALCDITAAGTQRKSIQNTFARRHEAARGRAELDAALAAGTPRLRVLVRRTSGDRCGALAGYALHIPSCWIIGQRARAVSVAPAEEPGESFEHYLGRMPANTTVCKYCKADPDHAITETITADGQHVHTCSCGLDSSPPRCSRDAAEDRLYRMHRAARARQAAP